MKNTQPQKYVFVLMPFSPEFNNIYSMCIKPACHEASVVCERLDEMIFAEGMLEKVYTQISKSDFLIADMSGRNPNVFYEVGYAHALNRNVILITNSETDIPFDLKHFQHIIYDKNDLAGLKEELVKKIEFYRATNNALEDIETEEPEFDFRISIQGEELDDGKVITIRPGEDWTEYNLSFNLDFSNQDSRLKEVQENQICLLVPKELVNNQNTQYPIVDRSFVQIDLGSVGSLYPKQAQALNAYIETNKMMGLNSFKGKQFLCILRIMLKRGIIEKRFKAFFYFEE